MSLRVNYTHIYSVLTGELVARCAGPNVNAKCELVQTETGMYALNVKPQESGEHLLTVTYKGEHIDGKRILHNSLNTLLSRSLLGRILC